MAKATGIVRRIDELGRVVIPKEIRRTQRIRQGDPLEIFTTADGEVIFKKYSPIGELADFAGQYTAVLYKTLGLGAFVCDRDEIVAAAGPGRREMLAQRVAAPLERLMEQRGRYAFAGGPDERLFPCEGCTRPVLAAAAIVSAGDVIGAVGLLADNAAASPTESQCKAVELAAGFLAGHMDT